MKDYVHGYSERETCRLYDQASTLSEMLHHDSVFPKGSMILEAGCGTGAQTVILAEKNPESAIISVDISPESVRKAKELTHFRNITNVDFEVNDLYTLRYDRESFDHIFICFVLEHLEDPVGMLAYLKQYLKPRGTITVIEGDHGSAYFFPESREAQMAIQCQVQIQSAMKGNSLIGRRLYPLLKDAGYGDVAVSPRMVYVDSGRPSLVDGFTKKTFIAMIEGVREQAVSAGLISEPEWEKGIRDLYRTTEKDGTFCYTFFKGTGIR